MRNCFNMGKDVNSDVQSVCGSDRGMSVSVKYIYSDTKRRWIPALVNMLVIFVVVLFLCLLEGMFSKIPLIFVRFAEVNVGETDVYILGDASRSVLDEGIRQRKTNVEVGRSSLIGLLDDSEISKSMVKNSIGSPEKLKDMAPRTFFPIRAKNRSNSELSLAATMMIYDDVKESSAGIGRNWNNRKLNEVEVHVSTEVSLPSKTMSSSCIVRACY